MVRALPGDERTTLDVGGGGGGCGRSLEAAFSI